MVADSSIITGADVSAERLHASIFPVWFQQKGGGEYISLRLASI